MWYTNPELNLDLKVRELTIIQHKHETLSIWIKTELESTRIDDDNTYMSIKAEIDSIEVP